MQERVSFVLSVGVAGLASLMLAACGTGAAPEAEVEPETSALATVVEETSASSRRVEAALEGCPAEVDGMLREEVSGYAESRGTTEKEALRRLRLERCFGVELGSLDRKLRRRESKSFAGLWIQHEPEYRYVVSFTEDGREKLKPYIKDEPYAPLIETRSSADATHAEIRAAQSRADSIIERSSLRANLGLNVQKNRAEVYVLDRRKAENKIARAGLRLPEHAALVEVERLVRLS